MRIRRWPTGQLEKPILDKRSFAACSTPATAKLKAKAKAKKHAFQVRAIDPSGNVDPSPAKWRFKLRRVG
jgi:hypothetical protein